MNCLLHLCKMVCINLRHFQGKERTFASCFCFFLHCLQGTPTAVRRRSPPEIPRNLWPPTFEFATASVCRMDRLGFVNQLLTQELWERPQGRAGQSSSKHALDLSNTANRHEQMWNRNAKVAIKSLHYAALTCDLRSTLLAYSAASMWHSQSHCLGSTMFHNVPYTGQWQGQRNLNICSVLCFLWIGSRRKRSPSTQFQNKANAEAMIRVR